MPDKLIKNKGAKVTCKDWGNHNGLPVYLFRLVNSSGAYVELTNYGAIFVSAVVPDVMGTLGHVVLGFDSLKAYLEDDCYIGATVGRYANRIGGAGFNLDGINYRLDNNDGSNCNHGGKHGFNSQVFQSIPTESGISFSLQSPDGAGGFPGNLQFNVTYSWTEGNELIIDYHAMTDKKTVANFTNHAYFNLNVSDRQLMDHRLLISSDMVLEVDDEYIPTGRISEAAEWKFSDQFLREKFKIDNSGISGFNKCFILADMSNNGLRFAASLREENSGRSLEVFTTYPAIMVYTGDYLKSEGNGHYDRRYGPFDGLSLECQYYPDSPNHQNFPSTVLEPGKAFGQTIIYKFGVK